MVKRLGWVIHWICIAIALPFLALFVYVYETGEPNILTWIVGVGIPVLAYAFGRAVRYVLAGE
jgi:hypothetical protein